MRRTGSTVPGGRRISWLVIIVLGMAVLMRGNTDAKVYIDITSPAIRKLPISIHSTGPAEARDLGRVIEKDLEFAGIFSLVDPDVPGAEIIARMEVETATGMRVTLSLRDLIENREIMKKRYEASRIIIRAMAHSIADDIYRAVTDRKGMFTTKISYLVNRGPGRKELRIMDWDGHNSLKTVTSGLTSSHSWSPDGRYLVYSAERKRKWKIYLLDLKDYRETVLFGATGLNLVGSVSSRDRIAFSSSKDGSSEIYLINRYGKGLKKLTRSFGIDVSPSFSPDGSRIAFVSDRGGTPQIYVMDAEGRGLRRLTFEGSYNTSPAWSPDGKWIVFVGRKNGKNQIFMVKSDGNELRQITFSGNNEGPSFSPDGLFLAFDSDRAGTRGIYLIRVNGEGQKRITPNNVNAMSPRWSPFLR